MIKNILFDFDGTIVDTSEGIIKSMHYAFEKLGIKSVNNLEIKEIIGPPLEEMFKILLNTDDKNVIDKGVYYFRERYSKRGLVELKLYENVQETLSYLKSLDVNLFIVTSKPHEFTKAISESLKIEKYFKDISGTQLKGETKSKADRVGELINKHNLKLEETIMVGDRKEDVLAASRNRLKTIGMLYGFGKKIDLGEAGCNIFCENFIDLKNKIKIYGES